MAFTDQEPELREEEFVAKERSSLDDLEPETKARYYKDVLGDADEQRIRDMEARNGVDLGPVNDDHRAKREAAARKAIEEPGEN